MRDLITIIESVDRPYNAFSGFGGRCGEAAVAINRVIFRGRGTLIGAFNEAFYDAGRLTGHVAVLCDGHYWDADARPKTRDEIESWGMLDLEDIDYTNFAKENGIEWNDHTASEVATFEMTEQDVFDAFGTKNLPDMMKSLGWTGSNDLLETEIKGGKRLSFTWEEDMENDQNRGFILHKLGAVLDGKEVGYLKIAYIPKDRYRRYYPSIFNYLDQIGGWSEMPYDKRHLHYSELTDDELKKFVEGISRRLSRFLSSASDPIGETREALLATAARLEKECLKSIQGKQFRDFVRFQVDCPYIGYVSVEGGNWAPEDYRRLGIGTALYLEGARRMAERGMKLHASGMQSPEAQAVWKKFEEKGWVALDKKSGRRYLKLTS